jgi:hypothetical protein
MMTNNVQKTQISEEMRVLLRVESRIVDSNLRLKRAETRLVVLAKALGHFDVMETSTPPRQ